MTALIWFMVFNSIAGAILCAYSRNLLAAIWALSCMFMSLAALPK